MAPQRSGEHIVLIFVGAFVAFVVASLLLAPTTTPGMCVDSPDPDASYCTEFPMQTLLGFEANAWVWIGALVVIVIRAAALIARGRRRRRAPRQ
ncbi:hypothetical protein [Microbacterium sp. HJ5]